MAAGDRTSVVAFTPEDPRLICPACDAVMQKKAAEKDVIDLCSECRAVWFDRGELERTTGATLPELPLGVQTRHHCPRCGGSLTASAVLDLEIYACSTHGFLVSGSSLDRSGLRDRLGSAGVVTEEPEGRVIVLPDLPYDELLDLREAFTKLLKATWNLWS